VGTCEALKLFKLTLGVDAIIGLQWMKDHKIWIIPSETLLAVA
jgi:hypothetical protein